MAKKLGLSFAELEQIKLKTLIDMANEESKDVSEEKVYGNPSDFKI